MTRLAVLLRLLQAHVAYDAREEADRCAMLRLAQELAEPLSRTEPSAHFHLDVRYLLVGRGEPCSGAAWHRVGEAGDASVGRLAAKALSLRTQP